MAVVTTMAISIFSCASEPKADAPASKEDVRQVMLDHGREVDECYVARRKAVPRLKGKMVVDWAVLPSGEVARVKVVESLDPVLDECIAGLVKTWKFPPTSTGKVQKIRYPFMFRTN